MLLDFSRLSLLTWRVGVRILLRGQEQGLHEMTVARAQHTAGVHTLQHTVQPLSYSNCRISEAGGPQDVHSQGESGQTGLSHWAAGEWAAGGQDGKRGEWAWGPRETGAGCQRSTGQAKGEEGRRTSREQTAHVNTSLMAPQREPLMPASAMGCLPTQQHQPAISSSRRPCFIVCWWALPDAVGLAGPEGNVFVCVVLPDFLHS